MFSRKTESLPPLAEQVAESAEQGIEATRALANDALDSLAGGVQDLRRTVPPLLDRATERAGALAQRGADAVRDGSLRLRDQALLTSERTVNYIRDEPVKAMLIAAASGAALMALLSLVRRPRGRA